MSKPSPWTQDHPTESGDYWWYHDEDAAPIVIAVLYSGTTGKCFIASGQHGWNRHQEFDEHRGAWYAPANPPEPLPEL